LNAQVRHVEVSGAASVDTVEAASGPQKIHKVLAQAGLGSRREMEELIRAGKVKVTVRSHSWACVSRRAT